MKTLNISLTNQSSGNKSVVRKLIANAAAIALVVTTLALGSVVPSPAHAACTGKGLEQIKAITDDMPKDAQRELLFQSVKKGCDIAMARLESYYLFPRDAQYDIGIKPNLKLAKYWFNQLPKDPVFFARHVQSTYIDGKTMLDSAEPASKKEALAALN